MVAGAAAPYLLALRFSGRRVLVVGAARWPPGAFPRCSRPARRSMWCPPP